MRHLFSKFLLSFVLGFMSIEAQDPNQTDTTTVTLLNNMTVETTLIAENTSEVITENTVTILMTDVVPSEITQDYQMNTTIEESTDGATMQSAFVTKQPTPKSVPERPTTEDDNTTAALEVFTSTTVTESATSDPMSSTSLHETTSADLTSSEHHEYETTTATVLMTTGPKETLTTVSEQITHMTESLPITSQTVDITTEASLDDTSTTSTTTPISTSQSLFDAPVLPHTASGDDILFAHSTPSTASANVRESMMPLQTDWFLIIIVCAVVICVLFGSMLLFVQWRKKNSSGKFGPGYVNGQSKRSKKIKGAERDAWAGPVHLEAEEGVECEELQGSLMSGDGNKDGDDVVLSTFSALEAEDTLNGGVGGDGTKEVRKWEEQEPLLYIDEDVKQDNMGQTVGSKDTQEENNGEKMLNGGETFCITTAV